VFANLIQDPPQVNHVENPAKPAEIDAFGQLEKLASTFDHVDGLFYFTYIVCIFFFVVITGVLAYSVVVYRRKTEDQPAASNTTHNTPLEVVWTIIPLIIVMVMFAWGFKGSLDMTTVPQNARMYKATAKQWNWTFTYPNDPVQSYGELWLEVDKPAAFLLESTDVLHAFYMPAMRVKRDVVPGRYQTLWFQPTHTGEFHLFCAEYCGQDHSKMYAKVHVVTAEEYAKRPWDQWDDKNPAKGGENLYKAPCSSCHSLNGSPMTGPSWKGLYVKDGSGAIVGAQREVLVGSQKQTVTVDDAYILESIAKPDAKKAVGFEKNNMTAFPNLEERKLKGIIEFMKNLAKDGQ
jgi:cytochrome c oxidase subunit 2